MLAIWVLAAISLVVSGAPSPREDRINGETGWYIPQEDGSFVWWSNAEAEWRMAELEANEEKSLSTHPVTFYLYTHANTKGVQIKSNADSIKSSTFNPSHPTRFVIHGWTQGHSSAMNKNIRNAWLSRGNYNVIIVDWARARSVDYATSVVAVPTSGKKVAAMIDYLAQNHGMSLKTLTVIGHSLGAHVSGYAGKNVKSGKIDSIWGLDPALPLFSYSKTAKRLYTNDANYVETFQTNGGGLGFLKPIGKSSFYPNGGQSQPGCTLDVSGACAHGRSVTYYAEAVEKNDFPSIKCGDYKDAVNNRCGSTYSSVRMGADANTVVASGAFYVPVKSKSPHGMGA